MTSILKRLFGEEFGNLLILNLLTVACSLPVITFVPAVIALWGTLIRVLDGRCELDRKKTYWALFKANLGKGILAELLIAAYGAMLLWCFSLAERLGDGAQLLWIAALSVSFLAAAVSVWLLLLLASSNAMRLREALWNAVCLSLGRLPRSLLAVLFTYGIAYGMFLLYPVSLIPCIVVVLSCMAALTVAACYQPLWDLVLSQWPDEPDSGDDGTTP